jgi:hypothetical protein
MPRTARASLGSLCYHFVPVSFLTFSPSFQLVYARLETPYLLFDNLKLDIKRLMKLHKSIDVIIDLVKSAFHLGKAVAHRPYNRGVTRLK